VRRLRDFILILTRTPKEPTMIDQTLSLAAQLDGIVKQLVSALQASQAQVAALTQKLADEASAADAAGVAALQPIVAEGQAAIPAS
jgi:hypothetical protein